MILLCQQYAEKCDGVNSLSIELGNDAMRAGFRSEANAYFKYGDQFDSLRKAQTFWFFL
jgi:hypothetical protein